MEVVGEKAVGAASPAMTRHDVVEDAQEELAIVVVGEDRLAAVASRNDVIRRPGGDDSRPARHALTLAPRAVRPSRRACPFTVSAAFWDRLGDCPLSWPQRTRGRYPARLVAPPWVSSARS